MTAGKVDQSIAEHSAQADSSYFLKTLAGPVVGVLCIVTLAIVLMLDDSKMQHEAAMHDHAIAVINAAGEAASGIVRLESGKRGYLLTGDPDYLVTSSRDVDTLTQRLDDLSRLTRGNREQYERVLALRDVLAEWLREHPTPPPPPLAPPPVPAAHSPAVPSTNDPAAPAPSSPLARSLADATNGLTSGAVLRPPPNAVPPSRGMADAAMGDDDPAPAPGTSGTAAFTPAPTMKEAEMKLARRGKLLTDKARLLLDEVLHEEQAFLAKRNSDAQNARQSLQILAFAPQLERLLMDLEGGSRGFLVSGQEEFLEPYRQGVSRLDVVTGHLLVLTAHNPRQVERLSRIREGVARWQAEAAIPEIEARRAGEDVRTLVQRGNGRVLMESIARDMQDFQAEAFREYEASRRQADQYRFSRLGVLLSLSAAAVCLLCLASWVGFNAQRKYVRNLLAAHALVQESEGRFLGFMNNSPTVAFMKNEEGRYVYISDPHEEQVGIPRSRIVGFTDKEVFPEFIAKQNRDNDLLVMETGRPLEIIEKEPASDGSIRDWLSFKFLFRDASGAKFVGGVSVDMTERLKAEEALAAERERLAVTLRSIGDGVITTDIDGRVRMINRVAENLTGWSQQEAAGQPLSTVFHVVDEATGAATRNPVETVIRTGRIVDMTNHTELVARDGKRRAVADSAAPIKDKDSKTIGVVLVFRDVTEKKRQEQEQQKADKLESIGLLAGGIAHDFNNILTAILGNLSLARSSMASAPGVDAIAAERVQDAEKATLRARDLAQQLLTFSKGGAPIRRTACISELVATTTTFFLRGSRARCKLNIAKDLWAAEIDTIQISQVIQNLIVNADQAMPEGGTITVSCENVTLPLAECPGEEAAAVQPDAESAGAKASPLDADIAATAAIPATAPLPTIRNQAPEAPAVEEVASTLPNGAAASGKPVPAPLPPGHRHFLRITVADEGIGIPRQYLTKIFDPYFTTKAKGSGLGLATAYAIAKNHGGLLSVESTAGKGSIFTLLLPSSGMPAPKPGEESRAAKATAARPARILVLDDEEMIRELVPRMLHDAGHNVTCAGDGATAIQLYENALRAGKPFDIVIMDLTIPGGIGGREVIAHLRQIHPGIRAIVSSGYATDPVMARYTEYGFVGVVTKPYEAGELHRVVAQILREPGQEPARAAAPATSIAVAVAVAVEAREQPPTPSASTAETPTPISAPAATPADAPAEAPQQVSAPAA
ncbi:hypothetical protein DB346_18260 [Verrucomicrobia bacterium LW23]|nr:hypothetical protein DB346_18260 [Verrucomicrobia bacterium LW23]